MRCKQRQSGKAAGEKNSTKLFRDGQGIWNQDSYAQAWNLFWLEIIKNGKPSRLERVI
jgi:hypothetical protein